MSPYGTHLTCAMPNMPWAEFGIWPAPGIPLEECDWTPGCVLPKDSMITVTDAPGFGADIQEEWLTPFFG